MTLNRPEKRNALSRELLQGLALALEALHGDQAVLVVVLAARGPAFCAGHDLGEMVGCSEESYRDLFSLCSHVMQQLRRLPQPVIARVQGLATAAGCQLVAACDLAVAVDTATFATPGVKIGLFCTTPMVPLVRAVPAKAAMEMLLTGKPISAQQALAWGLDQSLRARRPARRRRQGVHRRHPLQQSADGVAGQGAFYDQLALDEESAYVRATEVMTANACRRDAQEGMSAFLQKRKPAWTGE